jgi:hypothetical protein
MNPSMLLNDNDHPIMEKKDDTKPSHPNKTVPVCKLKQKSPFSMNAVGVDGMFIPILTHSRSGSVEIIV